MEKQDILLQMMEQPEKYTAQQWQEILDDPDCRRLYDTMSLTGSAVGSKTVADKLTDDNIFRQWEMVETAANQANEKNTVTHAKITPLRRWKIAAAVLAVVCFTGLTVAAVSNHWFEPKQEQPAEQTTEASQEAKVQSTFSDTAKTAQPAVRQPKTFVNVSLQDILTELSAYYHVELVWKNEQAKQLRLYFEWNPQDDINRIAEKLNNFQSVQLSMKNGKLIVE